MSSDASFVEFVVGQARGAGHIESRKMFGEYAVHCDGKLVMLVCDNRCFLKPTAATLDRLRDCPQAPPYPGAKPQPVVDELLDDAERIAELVRLTCDALPAPTPRAVKQSAAKKSGAKRAR